MSFKNSGNLPTPTEVAARLIGFYPAINAINPEAYAAGMVALFSRYPARLVAEAVDPVNGLPSLHDYSSTRTRPNRGATRSAGITKSGRTMIETSGSGRTMIGVRTVRPASA